MQLTKYTDYAFRILILLGKNEPQALLSIQDIANYYNISKNHLMKIVQMLVVHGVIQSVRGAQGGIRLAVHPKDINVRKIVEMTEATLQPVNCTEPACRLNTNCTLKSILYHAQELYLQHLAQYSLEDLLIDSDKTLSQIVKIK